MPSFKLNSSLSNADAGNHSDKTDNHVKDHDEKAMNKGRDVSTSSESSSGSRTKLCLKVKGSVSSTSSSGEEAAGNKEPELKLPIPTDTTKNADTLPAGSQRKRKRTAKALETDMAPKRKSAKTKAGEHAGRGSSSDSASKEGTGTRIVISSKPKGKSSSVSQSSEGERAKPTYRERAIEPATENPKRYANFRHLTTLYRNSVDDEAFAGAVAKLVARKGYPVLVAPEKRFEEIMPKVSPDVLVKAYNEASGAEDFADKVKNVHYGKNYTVVAED